MKKLLLLLLCVPLIFSCGEKEKDNKIKSSAKDINISEINDVCELVDAYLIVGDEIIELFDKYPLVDNENIPQDVMEKYEMLSHQEKEIGNKIRKEDWNDEEDFKHCKDWEKAAQLEDYIIELRVLDRINALQEEVQNHTRMDTTYKEETPENKVSEMGEIRTTTITDVGDVLTVNDIDVNELTIYPNPTSDITIIKEKRTYIFPNGDKYVGEYKDEKRHGKGTFISTKGDKYVGEWRDGLFNGKGTYTWGEGNNKGDKYVGEWKDGKHNGQGTYTWGEGDNKGDKYVGEFINNQKTGQGTCTYANGEKYVGEWKDGKSHGEGVYTLADGRIIEGLFEDGQYKNILSDEYNDSGTTIDFDNEEKHIVE